MALVDDSMGWREEPRRDLVVARAQVGMSRCLASMEAAAAVPRVFSGKRNSVVRREGIRRSYDDCVYSIC